MLASLKRQQQEDNSPVASPRRGVSDPIVQQIKESNKITKDVNDSAPADKCNSRSDLSGNKL